jgi:hypothetical protein
VIYGRKESVGIRWKIDARSGRFQFENGSDERRVLMGKSIVFLSRPGACFDVIDTRYVAVPTSFSSLLDHFLNQYVISIKEIYDLYEERGRGSVKRTILLNLLY